jgi:transcriptional regulator with XRE-family HTH domain
MDQGWWQAEKAEPCKKNRTLYVYAMRKPIAPHLSVNQCRAARAMLGWTMRELSAKSGVSLGTICNFESGRFVMLNANRRQLEATFRAAGLELLWEPKKRLIGVIGKAEVNKRELLPELPADDAEG